MTNFMNSKPTNATDALRLIKTIEKVKAGDFTIWNGGGGEWSVDSFKMVGGVKVKSTYEVDLNIPRCSCPDFAKHANYCKHILRVEIAISDEIKDEADACEMDVESYLRAMEQYGEVQYA